MKFSFPTRQHVARVTGESDWIALEDPSLPGRVHIRLQQSEEGRVVATGLILGLDQEREWTARDLRRVPVAQIVALFAQSMRNMPPGIPLEGGGTRFDVAGTFGDFLAIFGMGRITPYSGPHARPGPKGHPREHFERVAEAYKDVLPKFPRAPIAALAKDLHASPATVRRWVQRARDMGLLGPSIPGKPGEAPQRRASKGKR